MRQTLIARCTGALLVLALTACGGGGGSGSEATPDGDGPRTPLPKLARDDNPKAARLSVGPDDYLPQGTTESTFDRVDGNGNRVGSTMLRLVWQGGDTLQLSEAEDGGPPLAEGLQRTPAGWVQPVIANNQLPPASNAVIGGQLLVQSLAASPTAPGVVAVALATAGGSSSHAGVALVRDGVLMPVLTAPFSGSNQIVFGADGNSLFGIHTDSTEFGLRRMAVQADGLVATQEQTEAFASFHVQAIDRSGSRLVLSNRMVAADTLLQLGQVAGARDCRALNANRLACAAGFSSSTPGVLLVDAATAVITARLTIPGVSQGDTLRLVAGPSGQLVVRDQIRHPIVRDAGRVQLVRHPDLP